MENNTEKVHNPYRINQGDTITLIRQDAEKDGNHYTFYKVATKNKVDDDQTYHKQLKFPKGTDIPDGTRVKLIEFTEYGRHMDKYNDSYYLFVNEYEILGEDATSAISEYKEEINDNDDNIW